MMKNRNYTTCCIGMITLTLIILLMCCCRKHRKSLKCCNGRSETSPDCMDSEEACDDSPVRDNDDAN